MYFDAHGKFIRTDVWREGKWLDLWSVVHFLTGASLGFAPHILNVPTWPAFVIVFLLLVIYELFEAISKIEETVTNRIMDVVVGMTSFTPVYFVTAALPLSTLIIVCAAVSLITSFLAKLGWAESKKAEFLEKKMRHEFELQKEKFMSRRARRLKKKLSKKSFWHS